jgi:1-aminocyclopropane-1-carboxylate deaminase/D-cysteine desulfhydrase-like pyridoxal-dependent ACC family enzyme
MLIDNFLKIPRLTLAPLDTPVEKMDRLAGVIKGAPGLFIKRDDFIGQLVWGNKLRKLEYTIARALSAGADTLITCGAVQSNHARTTAQVAKRLGLDCYLVLNGTEPDIPAGNYRIVKLMNIKVRLVSSKEDREPEMNRLAEELSGNGKKPFIIPLGASDSNGVPGFVNAFLELMKQQKEMSNIFTHIYLATSSGGTQGGLEAGLRIVEKKNITITGISADDKPDAIAARIIASSNPVLEKLGCRELIQKEELTICSDFVGDGYGIPTPLSERAKRLFLENEGVLLDDTYTSKAAAGLIAHCESGMFKRTDNILFWHTGGLINLF